MLLMLFGLTLFLNHVPSPYSNSKICSVWMRREGGEGKVVFLFKQMMISNSELLH